MENTPFSFTMICTRHSTGWSVICTQHSTAQHSTAQHSTAQRNAAQPSPAHDHHSRQHTDVNDATQVVEGFKCLAMLLGWLFTAYCRDLHVYKGDLCYDMKTLRPTHVLHSVQANCNN